MPRENPIYYWPQADTLTEIIAVGIVVFLVAIALGLEWFRRRRDRKLRLDAEWRVARQIAEERELSGPEWKLLEGAIRRYQSESPHRAVTMRQYFDQIVDRDLEAVEQLRDPAVLEQRGVLLRDIRNRLGLAYIPLGQRIKSTRELYLDQVMWAGQDKDTSEWHRMKITNIDEAHFHAAPTGAQRTPPFKPGDTIIFRLWREEDARYEFQARLLRIEAEPHTYIFRHTRDLTRLQAREHFRVSFDQPVNVGIVNAPLNGDMHDVEKRQIVTRLRGRVTSLSAGGLAVLVQQPVPRQVLLRIPLDLDNGKPPLELTARLVDTHSLAGGQFLLRGAFVNLGEDDEEQITHFVFRKQQHHVAVELHEHHTVE
ncbi:MAG: PilZ domain-containing protein [Candidatus Hydrogenedentes bacterium]|nr:PilZ domain-containing protein [Candidatus Hydrogenedentota bacterium]MBI3118676.1 PilZ domain-containing protein [Candidatus Hydrogenedentota bacterium]